MSSFKPLRYDEDYSFMQMDTATNLYKAIKYSRLSRDGRAFISFGGEMRYQYLYTKNEEWGDVPQDDDGYTLTRWLTHADANFGGRFRAFFQLQSSFANSRPSPSPVDDNPLDIHQTFFDIVAASKKATFRVGRQELSFGSQRLVSVREVPNNRQSFDAVRSIFTSGQWKADIFYGYFVRAKSGIFDDKVSSDVKLWGLYIVRNNVTTIKNFDLYYLGLEKNSAEFNDGVGREQRHSIGTRLWNRDEDWRYDIEAVYQFGDFVSKDISAWTASLNLSYKFQRKKFSPEVGFKTELISGDKNENDERLQTFNPLFPRGAYFGLVALIGPANLFDIHPSISLNLSEKLTFNIDYDIFWRYDVDDGLYAVNMSVLYPSEATVGKHIGNQLAANLSYAPNDFLFFSCEFTWFNTGEYLKAVSSGNDILFTAATARLRF